MVTVFVNADPCMWCFSYTCLMLLWNTWAWFVSQPCPLCLESSEAWQFICYLSLFSLSLMTASNSISGFYHSPKVKLNSCDVFSISHQTIVWELDFTFINPKGLSIYLVSPNCIQLSKFSKIDVAVYTRHVFVRSL